MWRIKAIRNFSTLYALIATVALWAPLARAGIETTHHNLSASGPGPNKSSATSQICVFCHTPHNSIASQALWNQEMPAQTYQPYTSSTLYSHPGQPTGSSRMCLSCHDGTTAMGSLRVPPSGASVTLWPMQGQRVLGTDLSDDHPVSFVYDTALALQNTQLTDPATLTPQLPLDSTGQLQCTTCHDPHENQQGDVSGNFVRMGVVQMCMSCHGPMYGHGSTPSYWHDICYDCHSVHSAPVPEHLLKADPTELCASCHLYPYSGFSATADTNVGALSTTGSSTSPNASRRATKNLSLEFSKVSAHPISLSGKAHKSDEDPLTMPRHVTCIDCHDRHSTASSSSELSSIPSSLKGSSGVSVSGVFIKEASEEYEICFKCHGITNQATAGIVREDNTRNIRLELNPTNPSYHPVAATGKNSAIQGLTLGYNASSRISCVDCHNNDAWAQGGSSPKGPHGSRFSPILERQYEQSDPTPSSFQSAALCYKCHSQSAIANQGNFPHDKHLEGQASCAVCHDAHGSRRNIGLINFMLRDKGGKAVVEKNTNGVLAFSAIGDGHGECSLSCHGENHDRERY